MTRAPGLCGNCAFWRADDDDDDEGYEGECRRRAPTAPATARPSDIEDFVARWPVTLVDDWCGEFEPEPAHIKAVA